LKKSIEERAFHSALPMPPSSDEIGQHGCSDSFVAVGAAHGKQAKSRVDRRRAVLLNGEPARKAGSEPSSNQVF